MTTYLLGDSHLDGLGTAPGLGADVVNLAVGGSVAAALAGQIAGVDVAPGDCLVLSIGTNDADPTRGRPLGEFGAEVDDFVAAWPEQTWVYVASPGALADVTPEWTRAAIAAYSTRAAAPVRAVGGRVLDTPAVIAPLGTAAYTPDLFHLTAPAEALFVAALAQVLAQLEG